MSLIIANVQRDRALVGVDTAGSSDTHVGYAAVGNKMAILPAYHCVLAVRGVVQALWALGMSAGFTLMHSFDDVIECMPILLANANSVLAAECARRKLSPLLLAMQPIEIVAVGWSPREQRMLGFTYQKAVTDWAKLPIDEIRVHGAEIDWPDYPGPPIDHESIERVARWQMKNSRERDPSIAIGGRLLVATLTPVDVSIREQCSLDG